MCPSKAFCCVQLSPLCINTKARPSPRASGTAFCLPVLSPQGPLQVLYVKLWTGNETAYILLDPEKTIVMQACKFGLRKAGGTALGASCHTSHTSYSPQQACCLCDHRLSRPVASSESCWLHPDPPKLSPQHSVICCWRERERRIFSAWLFGP